MSRGILETIYVKLKPGNITDNDNNNDNNNYAVIYLHHRI